MLIVVKIGTNVLSQANGLLDMTTMSHLCDQVAALKKEGHQVIIVTSGAVGAGRKVLPNLNDKNKIEHRQVLAAVGQIRLMQIYLQFFSQYNIHVAQVLATKEDFRDRQHYLNMKNCLNALLLDDIIPIVNENDVVAVTELMFTDNDELSGLIAAMTNANVFVILSNIDGVFNGKPSESESYVIHEVLPDDKKILSFISSEKSSFGRGGMETKLRIAQKTAKIGIETYIANGKGTAILTRILNEEKIGTHFLAQKNVSNLKKWLAYNELSEKGTIYINKGAADALNSHVSSLLPIGVTRLEGNFQKGDLVKIKYEEQIIAVGMAQIAASAAEKIIGQAHKKAIIHYDYLYVY